MTAALHMMFVIMFARARWFLHVFCMFLRVLIVLVSKRYLFI